MRPRSAIALLLDINMAFDFVTKPASDRDAGGALARRVSQAPPAGSRNTALRSPPK
jgi:hypothetical protein